MKIVMMASRPNEIELTAAITMTLAQWQQLAEQCRGKYPGWKLTQAISSIVYNVNMKLEEQVVES